MVEARKYAVEAKNAPIFVGRYEDGKRIDGIQEAVEYLQECKNNGQNVYIVFNGQKLYSCDVTLDSAYMQIIGMTKEEDDAVRQEYVKAETEEERSAILERWVGIQKKYQEEAKKNAVEATGAPLFVGRFENGVRIDGIQEAVEYLQRCKSERSKCICRFQWTKIIFM